MADPKNPKTGGKELSFSLQGEKMNASKSQPTDSAQPPWLSALNELLDRIDPKDAERAVKNLEAYMDGDATLAQVQGVPQQMLFDIAEQAYLKFKSSRLEEAEGMFKGLSVLDHKTAYYHTALGAIYQKQEKFLDALAEYTVATELDTEDITAHVNRGEIYYTLGLEEESLKDFERAIKLDDSAKDPWANRARFLKKQILDDMAERVAYQK